MCSHANPTGMAFSSGFLFLKIKVYIKNSFFSSERTRHYVNAFSKKIKYDTIYFNNMALHHMLGLTNLQLSCLEWRGRLLRE